MCSRIRSLVFLSHIELRFIAVLGKAVGVGSMWLSPSSFPFLVLYWGSDLVPRLSLRCFLWWESFPPTCRLVGLTHPCRRILMHFLLRPCFGTWGFLVEFWRTLLFEPIFELVCYHFEFLWFLAMRRVSCTLGHSRLLVWLAVHSCGVSLGGVLWSSLPGFVFPVSSKSEIDPVLLDTLAIGTACPWPWVLLGGFCS